MANVNPFTPVGATVTVSATTSSSDEALPATAVGSSTTNAGTIGGADVLRFYNAGTAIAFVRWGVGAQTAVTTDMPVAPGTIEVFSKAYEADTVAAITAAGTATVYVTAGRGQ